MKPDQLPIYLINLKKDRHRRVNSIKQLNDIGLRPNIISAYNGHQYDFPFYKYRNLSRGIWWDKNVFKPGAFACYLSHSKCWKMISTGDDSYGIILEDDIKVNKDAFEKFNIDIKEFDIIFINFGVTRLLKLIEYKIDAQDNAFVPLNDVLTNLLINNKFENRLSPGSYGYIVSKKGASKLLKMMEREKICMGVDFAMIFNSLSNQSIEQIKQLKSLPLYLQHYLDNINELSFYSDPNRVILNSYIYNFPPLISHNDDGESSLKHEILQSFDIFHISRWKIIRALINIIKPSDKQ